MISLREEILRLLEEDEEFRLIVAGLLGYKSILNRFKEYDKKFYEILKELKEHREILEKHTKILEEHTKILYESVRILEEHTSILKEYGRKLNEHDEKFNEIMSEIHALREDFLKLNRKIEVTLGSMGRRWGFDLERTVLEIFREVLERKGIEPGKVKKFKFKDKDGSVTGIKGRVIDVDILVHDDKVYVIEVKSRAEIDHVEQLIEKAKVVEKILGKHVEKVFIVAVNVDREAYERALELGIEVIAGNILD
ncbi:MAG: microtubule-binding protein [Thermoprotei archaeon]|nr:MAG: microtubule-binding protein [Thermoprotei archaeon]